VIGDHKLSATTRADLIRPLIEQLLQIVEPEPGRSGIAETPTRVGKAWVEWTEGYSVDPVALLKSFEDGATDYNEMVMQRKIPFVSHCEHHMAPFTGHVTVAYIPGDKIVGLSKMNRIVDAFAHRLQVQERITTQIADLLWNNLAPKGVGVLVQASHGCISSRGVRHHGTDTITSAYRGAMFEDAKARSEFLELAKLP